MICKLKFGMTRANFFQWKTFYFSTIGIKNWALKVSRCQKSWRTFIFTCREKTSMRKKHDLFRNKSHKKVRSHFQVRRIFQIETKFSENQRFFTFYLFHLRLEILIQISKLRKECKNSSASKSTISST